MDFEQSLLRVAERYRSQGYEVTIRPSPSQLPAFATDFKLELLGRRGSGGVLVAVKTNRDEVAADANMQRYAEITGAQSGWRFDFEILESENPNARDMRGAREFTDVDLTRSLDQARQLSQMGFSRVAIVAAWASLEAAMRMRLRALGQEAGWGSMPRQMVKELYSAGELSPDEFNRVELASQLRNQIVHGFSSSDSTESAAFENGLVGLLSDLARRFVEQSQPERQSA